jgi:hypothetical protein
MKIIIKESNLDKIIKASEASDDLNSVLTVAKGKRGLSFVTIKSNPDYILKGIYFLVKNYDLQSMYVNGNPYDAYIIYMKGFEKDAMELKSIAEKYNGFLSAKATEEDSRRIGQLLSYDPRDIEDYINRNREIRKKMD